MSRSIDKAARKAQLAEAVWQVILEQGISAVSIRTVAEQAGLVVGSLRHVFPARAELVKFSAELMVQRATERVLATPFKDDPQDYVLDVIKRLLPLEPDSRAELEVNTALLAECAAMPELIPIRDLAHQQLADACVRLVQLLTDTPPDAETIASARRLHAMLDGFAFHLLHRPLDEDPDWAISIIRDELDRIRDRTR